MCVFVCISHTCRNLNFAKNVTTLLHWADDMKCLINSVKNSSSKKKKRIPTDLPYFCSARYANITIFFFWPYPSPLPTKQCWEVQQGSWQHDFYQHCTEGGGQNSVTAIKLFQHFFSMIVEFEAYCLHV